MFVSVLELLELLEMLDPPCIEELDVAVAELSVLTLGDM